MRTYREDILFEENEKLKEDLLLWQEFREICNSMEQKDGHKDIKPIKVAISSYCVLKTKRLRELVKMLGLKIG
jgi:hypothetical protein